MNCCVQLILEQYIFMEGEHLLLLFQWSNPYRLVLYHLFCYSLYFTNTSCSCLLASATESKMFLSLVSAMEFMGNLLLKPLNGLLQDTGNIFATWIYDMNRVLWQKPVFKATIHNPLFASLLKSDHLAAAIKEDEDEVFWKASYYLLFAVIPILKAPKYCEQWAAFLQSTKFSFWQSMQVKHCLISRKFMMTKIL